MNTFFIVTTAVVWPWKQDPFTHSVTIAWPEFKRNVFESHKDHWFVLSTGPNLWQFWFWTHPLLRTYCKVRNWKGTWMACLELCQGTQSNLTTTRVRHSSYLRRKFLNFRWPSHFLSMGQLSESVPWVQHSLALNWKRPLLGSILLLQHLNCWLEDLAGWNNLQPYVFFVLIWKRKGIVFAKKKEDLFQVWGTQVRSYLLGEKWRSWSTYMQSYCRHFPNPIKPKHLQWQSPWHCEAA